MCGSRTVLRMYSVLERRLAFWIVCVLSCACVDICVMSCVCCVAGCVANVCAWSTHIVQKALELNLLPINNFPQAHVVSCGTQEVRTGCCLVWDPHDLGCGVWMLKGTLDLKDFSFLVELDDIHPISVIL